MPVPLSVHSSVVDMETIKSTDIPIPCRVPMVQSATDYVHLPHRPITAYTSAQLCDVRVLSFATLIFLFLFITTLLTSFFITGSVQANSSSMVEVLMHLLAQKLLELLRLGVVTHHSDSVLPITSVSSLTPTVGVNEIPPLAIQLAHLH